MKKVLILVFALNTTISFAKKGVPDESVLTLLLNLNEYRTIDGAGNNIHNPDWGKAGTPLLRMKKSYYSDHYNTPSGADRPSAREISNVVVVQNGSIPNHHGISDLFWAWGQFLDHDISLSEAAPGPESFDIPIPLGDIYFDPNNTGTEVMNFHRTIYTGGVYSPREQINQITAFIDASHIYGSDPIRAQTLRTLDGTGKLKMSANRRPPYNTYGLPNQSLPGTDPEDYFLTGDVRANEVVSLLALHTIFVREHNRLAEIFKELCPGATGEQIYQMARTIVGAEIQAITYNEFLPILFGAYGLTPFVRYNPRINPGVMNEFSSAAFRFGHSMLSPKILRIGKNGKEYYKGHLPLRNAFFSPHEVTYPYSIEAVFKGLIRQKAQKIDNHVVDDVRNFLFGQPLEGGFDLASANIQRGRDHGLPSYNSAREDLGLTPVWEFSNVNVDPKVHGPLRGAYKHVNYIDLWVGGLAEMPAGGLLGPTFHMIIRDQFRRLRDGDRFFYLHALPEEVVEYVEFMTLSRIIKVNTKLGRRFSRYPFYVRN